MTTTENTTDMHIDFVPLLVDGVDIEVRPVPKPNLPFFVYGTLRHGQGNYEWALQGRTTREREASFVGGALFDGGAFPYMIREVGHTDNARVIGDLMDVPAEHYADVLNDLDTLEGYNPRRAQNLYQRIEIDVTTTDGETVRAYTYVADTGMYNRVLSYDVIPSGDWVRDGARFAR
jgi:gamma-glutamylcyclotransferase (GGCT)/AIG2-like uncharacterized protein YtfP